MRPIARAARSSLLLAAIAPSLSAQARPAPPAPAPPYVADARLGEPYLIGRTFATANRSMVDESEHLVVSVDTARLALRFPTRDRQVVAGEGQQLLLLTGTVRNPQRVDVDVTGGTMMTVRFFGNAREAPRLYGQEITVDPDSLRSLKRTLPPGESARYTMALRVPSDRPALQLATLRPYGPIRRYDLAADVTGDRSVFARSGASVAASARVGVGEPFDFDALDLRVSAVREVPRVGAYAASPGKHLFAAEVQVTNRMLLAEPWGWQYCTPELTDAAGRAVPWGRDMLDARTGQTFSRDLAPGETATVVYVFTADAPLTPAALALTMLATKRRVEVALR